MRKRLLGLVSGLAMCAVLGLIVLNGPAAAAPGDPGSAFFAYLNGAQEVPPTNTDVTGMATMRVTEDGQALEYTLTVYGIMNPFMGHIHLGAPGVAGPIVLDLIPMGKPNSGMQNIIATGRATATDLKGPLAGKPLSALTSQLAFNTYVNVHTSNGTMTFAEGNYPNGEVRGNIMSADANRVGTQPALPTSVNIAPAGPTFAAFPAFGVPVTVPSVAAPTAAVAPVGVAPAGGVPGAPATGTQPLSTRSPANGDVSNPGVPAGQPGAQPGSSSSAAGGSTMGAASGAATTGGSGTSNTNPTGAGGTSAGPQTGNIGQGGSATTGNTSGVGSVPMGSSGGSGAVTNPGAPTTP